MGEKTEIAWTDSTFNPWVGCQKVSPGCDRCYAEQLMDKRYHRVVWGPHGERVRTSASNWKLPVRWQREAEAFRKQHGRNRRVFCASLADVFDNRVPWEWRNDLFRLICETPDLTWLLLTKRPENIGRMLLQVYGSQEPPYNVWLGTTAEDQEHYDRRWPILRGINAVVRFISYEPAIGPLLLHENDGRHPDWIICGGESGTGYRDMPEDWARELRAECHTACVPFFMKQMAGKKPIPPDLMVRQFPEVAN